MFRKGQRLPSIRALFFVSLFLLLPLCPALARQVTTDAGPLFQGVVTDARSGIRLATATVSLYGPDGTQVLSSFTDQEGRYTLQAPGRDPYRLRAERVGYHPQEQGPFFFQSSDTATVDFKLPPAPLLLDSILVRVRRRARALSAGEQLVYGRLLDDESGAPIPQGLIRLLRESGQGAATTLSDDEGLFWLVSPQAGTFRLQAERIGYRTSTGPELYLMLGDSLGVDFYLSMEAVLLEPLVVRATSRPIEDRYDLTGMGGFLQRYSTFSGFGDFLTRDSIAKYEDWSISTGQMLLLTTMSVRTASPISPQVTLRGGCSPRYFVNGFPVPPGFPFDYAPDQLEAVEVYVRPAIPGEFLIGGGFPCGVVALWTRLTPDPRPDSPGWKKWLAGLGLVSLGFLATLL